MSEKQFFNIEHFKNAMLQMNESNQISVRLFPTYEAKLSVVCDVNDQAKIEFMDK